MLELELDRELEREPIFSLSLYCYFARTELFPDQKSIFIFSFISQKIQDFREYFFSEKCLDTRPLAGVCVLYMYSSLQETGPLQAPSSILENGYRHATSGSAGD